MYPCVECIYRCRVPSGRLMFFSKDLSSFLKFSEGLFCFQSLVVGLWALLCLERTLSHPTDATMSLSPFGYMASISVFTGSMLVVSWVYLLGTFRWFRQDPRADFYFHCSWGKHILVKGTLDVLLLSHFILLIPSVSHGLSSWLRVYTTVHGFSVLCGVSLFAFFWHARLWLLLDTYYTLDTPHEVDNVTKRGTPSRRVFVTLYALLCAGIVIGVGCLVGELVRWTYHVGRGHADVFPSSFFLLSGAVTLCISGVVFIIGLLYTRSFFTAPLHIVWRAPFAGFVVPCILWLHFTFYVSWVGWCVWDLKTPSSVPMGDSLTLIDVWDLLVSPGAPDVRSELVFLHHLHLFLGCLFIFLPLLVSALISAFELYFPYKVAAPSGGVPLRPMAILVNPSHPSPPVY